MKFAKTNADGFVKDEETNVIINKNMTEYEKILERRRHKRELDTVTSEVSQLKNEVDELKGLLTKILKEK
jgi:hypothetical protein